MIKFNESPNVGTDIEIEYVKDAIETGHISNNGKYTKLVQELLEKHLHSQKVLLTTSGTMALELAAMTLKLEPGDEVICPSYTFVTTVSSFIRCGAVPVFVDVNPGTMCIDENLIEDAITDKTKAIMVVHYAGMACDMDKVLEIAKKHNLYVIEDAAQVLDAKYKDKYLGTIGDVGCFSFHETKNYSMGEGGAVSVNNPALLDNVDIVREVGTNRRQFINGQVDKYTWVDLGSSFSPSELNAAYFYPQVLKIDEINENRVNSFNRYYNGLKELEDKGIIGLPHVPEYSSINGHMFYINTKNLEDRMSLQKFLRENGIESAFHYVPLHSAPAGQRFGRFHGEDKYTTSGFERLLRLPMYYGLKEEDVDYVVLKIKEYYSK